LNPESGQIIPLFHPRKDRWKDHFVVGVETSMPLGIEIQGLTAGQTTLRLLGMNEEMQQMLRYELWLERLYPCKEA
jgi:hypothetical protein